MRVLTAATAVVSVLLFVLGFGRKHWGEACQHDNECKPRLVCGVPMGAPYCTQSMRTGRA